MEYYFFFDYSNFSRRLLEELLGLADDLLAAVFPTRSQGLADDEYSAYNIYIYMPPILQKDKPAYVYRVYIYYILDIVQL